MAQPPKKKFKTRPNKMAQAAAEKDALRKMINFTLLFLLIPAIVFGVKQVNPGIFFRVQGMVLEKVGQRDGAARAFESAFNADPARNVGALVDAARLHEYEEHWEAVDQIARRVRENHEVAAPEHLAASDFFLGRLAFEEGRWDDALKLGESAQKNAKGDYIYRSWILIGATLTRKAAGDDNTYKKADDALRQAVAQRRLFAPEAHYYMGQLYEVWRNQKAQAIDEYEYGLAQGPSPKLKRKLLAAKSRLVTGQ